MSSPVDVAWLPEGAPEGHHPREVAWEPQKRSEKRKATMAAKAHATGFRPGDLVTIHDRTRYNGKQGHVVTTNLGEVGVSITKTDDVDAWFLPTELVRR